MIMTHRLPGENKENNMNNHNKVNNTPQIINKKTLIKKNTISIVPNKSIPLKMSMLKSSK